MTSEPCWSSGAIVSTANSSIFVVVVTIVVVVKNAVLVADSTAVATSIKSNLSYNQYMLIS
jgi:hypothetical protein